jgi:hypothetical protein
MGIGRERQSVKQQEAGAGWIGASLLRNEGARAANVEVGL